MIIGQQQIQNQVNTIFDIFKDSETKIRPHFFLTGPSGSGKTFIIENLAKQKGFNFLKVNAASLTKEGTSGNSLSKALSPLLNNNSKPTVVFVDEFDKLFISGNSNSDLAHETTNGVQNEFLTVLESSKASVFGDYGKYVNIRVDNCLFVFAGAFNGQKDITVWDLKNFGVKTEFLGRVNLIYNTSPITLEEMYTILENSPLLEKYLNLFSDKDKESVVTNLKNQIKIRFEDNEIGVRLINSLIHKYFIEGEKIELEESFIEL